MTILDDFYRTCAEAGSLASELGVPAVLITTKAELLPFSDLIVVEVVKGRTPVATLAAGLRLRTRRLLKTNETP